MYKIRIFGTCKKKNIKVIANNDQFALITILGRGVWILKTAAAVDSFKKGVKK